MSGTELGYKRYLARLEKQRLKYNETKARILYEARDDKGNRGLMSGVEIQNGARLVIDPRDIEKEGSTPIQDLEAAKLQIRYQYLPQGTEYEILPSIPPETKRLDLYDFTHIRVHPDSSVYCYLMHIRESEERIAKPIFALIPPLPKHELIDQEIGPEIALPRRRNGAKIFSLARIVLTAFRGKVHAKQVIHYRDGNKRNCQLSNLFVRLPVRQRRILEPMKRGKSKLTAKDVIDIRYRHYSLNQRICDIHLLYPNVLYQSLWLAVVGRTWKELPLQPTSEQWENAKGDQ